MAYEIPTVKQLEKNLSQRIKTLYDLKFDTSTKNVICKLFSTYLIVIADEALTSLEKQLWQQEKEDLCIEIRSEISNIFHPELQELIEELTQVGVEDIVSNVSYTSNKFGAMAILSHYPVVRKSSSNPARMPQEYPPRSQ